MSRALLPPLCTITSRSLALALALALAACGGNDPPPNNSEDMATPAGQVDMTTNTNNGPKIISLGTNVTQITTGESVRFVAVVTDPSGLQNLVGGQLTSPDGSIKYGAFIAAQQGSYNLELSWGQINQAQPINFAMEDKRSFVAEFYNVAGLKSSQAVMLRLHCTTAAGMVRGACAGVCSSEGDICGGGMGRICVAGSCAPGCYIDNMLIKPDTLRPGNACQSCQPTVRTSSYSAVKDDTTCGNGVYCRSGNCVVRFQTRPGTGANTFMGSPSDLWASAANNVYAISDRGSIYRTTDSGMTWTASYSPAAFTETYNAIWGPNANEIFAVGSNGRVARTTNGGMNWTSTVVAAAAGAYMNGVWGSAANDVYAVGQAGLILRWNGTTWTKQTNPSTDNLNNVRGVGGAVYAVGSNGTILKTTNQGATWTRQTSNVTTTLYGIFDLGANELWVVGSITVLRSTNGGTTWTKVNFTEANNVYAVWGTGTDNLFLGTSLGIYRTTDAGMTWLNQNGPSSTVYTLFGTAASDLWALTSSGIYRNY